MKYFIFDDLNSLDLGLEIVSCSIGSPNPNIIKVSVPYQNGAYDFSTIGSNGFMTYENRLITVNANFLGTNKNDMYTIYSDIATFLLGQSSKLQFNYINGFYKAKCTKISDLTSFLNLGTINITFECYPFLNAGEYGKQLWNDFNFETGISEINNIPLKVNKEFTIYNKGIGKEVIFNVSNSCEILLNNKKISLNKGNNNVPFKAGNNILNTVSISKTNTTPILIINYEKEII